MNKFLVIALLWIFQSIRYSIACYGYTIEIVRLESGSHNRMKFEDNYHLEVTDDCRVFVSFCVTFDRPYNSALISIKSRTSFMDLITVRNKDFCTYLSDHKIVDMECPSAKAGRTCTKHGEVANISDFGPFLGFLVGNVTVLIRLDYDDTDVPDVGSMLLNVKIKNAL